MLRLSDEDVKLHALLSKTPEYDAPFQSAGLADPPFCSSTVMWEVLFERLKSIHILTISPWDLNPCATHQCHSKVPVRQRTGNIIIQTVHILQHDSADTKPHCP